MMMFALSVDKVIYLILMFVEIFQLDVMWYEITMVYVKVALKDIIIQDINVFIKTLLSLDVIFIIKLDHAYHVKTDLNYIKENV